MLHAGESGWPGEGWGGIVGTMRRRSKFEVSWKDWAVAIALGAIVVLLCVLALVTWGGWSRQRDVARAMEPPPKSGDLQWTSKEL
jgi:heme/copper-type cytochrome/quinol oxidase subunit 1